MIKKFFIPLSIALAFAAFTACDDDDDDVTDGNGNVENVDILPKKITRITYHDEQDYCHYRDISYNDDGAIIIYSKDNSEYSHTFEYSQDKIIETITDYDDEEICEYSLNNGRATGYIWKWKEYDGSWNSSTRTFLYSGNWLTEIRHDNGNYYTYRHDNENLIETKYVSKSDDDNEMYTTYQCVYQFDGQPNNLNIDLFYLFERDVFFLLNIVGQRSKYLPSYYQEEETGGDGRWIVKTNVTYETDADGYITKIKESGIRGYEGDTWNFESTYTLTYE